MAQSVENERIDCAQKVLKVHYEVIQRQSLSSKGSSIKEKVIQDKMKIARQNAEHFFTEKRRAKENHQESSRIQEQLMKDGTGTSRCKRDSNNGETGGTRLGRYG